MENFIKIREFCNANNCLLLLNFEEFENKRQNVLNKYYQYVRIDFVGICGHNSSAVVTNFLNRKTGIRCKDCVKKSTISSQRNKQKQTLSVESESMEILIPFLEKNYEVVRTNEGCLADLAVRKSSYNEKYIPIQVKSTEKKCHGMYSFRKVKSTYKDMILICVCISEKKCWLIPYNDLTINQENLNISSRSKYNKYLIDNNNSIHDYIDRYCENYQKYNLNDLLRPISELQQREQDYVQKREKIISLKYEHPLIQQSVTDFIINGKKVQEKVAGKVTSKKKTKNGMIVQVASNNGKNERGIRQFRTYCLGENDFYWIHSSIDNRFWIIPENVLYEREYISKPNEIQKRKVIYISDNTKWIKEFEYNYDNVNKEQIEKIFE